MADVLAKQAHGKAPRCPDNGLLLQLMAKLGNLDHLCLHLARSAGLPPIEHLRLKWNPDSETLFPKELAISQLLPGCAAAERQVSKVCALSLASYNALSLLADREVRTL